MVITFPTINITMQESKTFVKGESGMDTSMKEKFKRVIELYDDMIRLPHKTEIARELRDEEDLFLLLLYSDMLGIPNPVYYYTLELYPYIIEKFHDWHLRMGMEHSPLDGMRCC